MFDLIYRLLVGSPPSRHAPSPRRSKGPGSQPNGRVAHKPTRHKPAKALHPGSATKAPSGGLTVYHGTPSLENAKSIIRHGWIVGGGNAFGDGVYVTTSVAMARGYAGATGFLVKARLDPGKCAVWSTSLDRAFQGWVASRGCAPDMSARTAFLLERGYRTLRNNNVYVVLLRGYRNPAATKVKLKSLRVVEVQDANTGRRARF